LGLFSPLVALTLFSAAFSAQELRFRSGETLTRPAVSVRAPRELARRLTGTERHVLVRFERAPDAHTRALLAAAGVELGHALGAGAYFARVVSTRLDTVAIARQGGLVDVRELELSWKLHPDLLAGAERPWTVVARDAAGAPTLAVYALLQEDAALEEVAGALGELGGTLFDELESVGGLVAFVPRARLSEFAALDAIAWVEPALPQLDTVGLKRNDSNRAMVQANTLQAAPYSLTGAGVKVLVYDGGTARATHTDFGGRLVSRDASGLIDHATHVAATIGGSGAASGGLRAGMAPGVTIESYGFQYDGSGVFFFTNPGDFESDYQAAFALGADIANNSIGTNVEPNGFHCPIQGDYSVLDVLIDEVVRGSLGAPFRVVWANGNERQGTRCDVEGFPGYYSTAPPATAKNHITVGALNSNDDSMTSFSSWGPTDDGRLKPDISAPGCQAGGDNGVTSAGASSDVSYVTFCGTSMASPTVCGISALILEDWRAQFGGADPRNSTLKALLAHTAFDRGNVGPDFLYGYGSVRAQTAVDFMRLGQFEESELVETGAARRWTVTVAPATSELRLTLAWDDAPALPNVFGSLVNDLDLVVRDPNGTQHHVWTLDPESPSTAAVRTAADHRNNLEQVLVNAPLAGIWTIEVRGFDVPEGPQPFSLTSSHALVVPPHVSLSFPNGLPTILTPGVATNVDVRVVGVSDTLVGGSPTLHVRYDAGAYLVLPMTALGGDLWRATLPPGVCTATPDFWFSAQGLASGLTASPASAPGDTYTALVATTSTAFQDDFDTNLGWSVTNTAITGGGWARGTPIGGGTRGDPLAAFGGAGQCYLTENVAGNSDVDGGPTTLTSPLIDLSSGASFVLSYARWFTNDDYDIDSMTVELSNDNGSSWTTLEFIDDGGSGGGWVTRSGLVEAVLAPTNQMRLRVSVTDNPNDSVTEAGFDAIRIERRDCAALPDCNGNGILDADDIESGRSLDVNNDNVPDECAPPPPPKVRQNPNPPGTAPDATVP
jgi:hypothetical protein